jgi:hypothetical protein
MIVAAAILSVGCADPSAPPLQSDPLAASTSVVGGWDISASGGGESFVTAPVPAIGVAAFTFNARQDADGNAMGRFQLKRQRAGFTVDFTGEVTCMAVDPATRRAWIGGVVTENRSDDPVHSLEIHQPGQDVWFRVVDNGEGANAAPDRSSVYGFQGALGVITSAEYCERKLWAADDANAFEVTKGNIQVRF